MTRKTFCDQCTKEIPYYTVNVKIEAKGPACAQSGFYGGREGEFCSSACATAWVAWQCQPDISPGGEEWNLHAECSKTGRCLIGNGLCPHIKEGVSDPKGRSPSSFAGPQPYRTEVEP
jgi:hypothetical protein